MDAQNDLIRLLAEQLYIEFAARTDPKNWDWMPVATRAIEAAEVFSAVFAAAKVQPESKSAASAKSPSPVPEATASPSPSPTVSPTAPQAPASAPIGDKPHNQKEKNKMPKEPPQEAPPEEPVEPEGSGIKSYPDPTISPEQYAEKEKSGAPPTHLAREPAGPTAPAESPPSPVNGEVVHKSTQ